MCERVQAAREEGIDLRAQAVLFRTGHDSDLLELELTRRGIPFVKYGGLRFLEAAHVKDLIALLRLVDNPADELSWFRVLQLLDGVGPTRARRMLQALRGEPQTGAGPRAEPAAEGPSPAPARRDSPAFLRPPRSFPRVRANMPMRCSARSRRRPPKRRRRPSSSWSGCARRSRR